MDIANECGNNVGNDQILAANGKVKGSGPRISMADVEKEIVRESYHIFPGTTMTVCCLTLRNGHSVIGQSACIAKENFDIALGAKYARENAVDNVFPLLAYLVSQRIFTFGS